MSADTSYRLDAARLKLASDLLEAEYRSVSISDRARALLMALQIVAYSLPPWIAAYLVAHALEARWAGGLLTGIPPMIVGLIVLLILNTPLVRKAWRQQRLARRARALVLLENQLPSGSSSSGRWLRTGLTLAAPLLLLGLSLRSLGSSQATWSERSLVVGVTVVLPVTLLLFDRLLERLRRRIDYYREVMDVRARLRQRDAEAEGGVELPRELASRIDAIESVRLLHRREAAALQARRRPSAGFVVAMQREARRSLQRLSADQRLLVQQALEELSDAPRPDAAGRVEADHRSSRVKGTDLVLHYTVDERMGRVEVLSVTVGARRSEAEDEPS